MTSSARSRGIKGRRSSIRDPPCHDLEDGRFSGSGLSDDVEVPESILGVEVYLLFFSPVGIGPKVESDTRNIFWRRCEFVVLPFNRFDMVIFGRREVEESRELAGAKEHFW